MDNNIEKDFDFKPIKSTLDRVILIIQNKFERECYFEDQSIQTALRLLFKMAIVNSQGIIYLCESGENDKSFLYLNCPPLNRSLFDNLIQTIFLLEDTSRFRENFYKTRLREAKEIYNFRTKEYGIDNNSTDHINDLESFIEEKWGLSEKEKGDFKKLPKHISTNQIVNEFVDKKLSIAPFLEYLRNLYYWNLSQFSHSQPTAFVLFYNQILETNNARLIEYINNERWTSLNFILCLFSEIEIHLNLEMKDDLLILWSYIKEGSPYTNKIYNLRYKEVFGEIPIFAGK